MYILGISSNVNISSAVLLKDGVIIAGAPEERFTRKKFSREFPINAVRFCLQFEKISLEDVDYIAIANDPGISLDKYLSKQSDILRWYGEIIYQIPNSLTLLKKDSYKGPMKMEIINEKSKNSIYYISHHKCHIANAFYLSGFEKSAILTVDGRGEDATATYAYGDKNNIIIKKVVKFPFSLGLFFGAITDFLGYQHDRDEWKIMGMAGMTSYNNEYYHKLKDLFFLNDDGSFEYDLSYFRLYSESAELLFSDKMIDLLGNNRRSNEEFLERHFKIAAAAQKVLEDILNFMLEKLYTYTQCNNLVVAGGVFMNSAYNAQILESSRFKKIFISSCPDDSGISIGAALFLYHNILKASDNTYRQKTNYYGPSYTNLDIEYYLNKNKIIYQYCEDVEVKIARELANGKVIGWFQGRMEFGQRALGNRSILADPRNKKMKDIVNEKVKYRETYRPFAPVVLEQDFEDYFEYPEKEDTYFMSLSVKAKEKCIKKAPAIVHDNGTSRVQVTNDMLNPTLAQLLKEFKKVTGVGVLLNTSFNKNGEPIVCEIEDAIKTFFTTGLDILVLGNFIISK